MPFTFTQNNFTRFPSAAICEKNMSLLGCHHACLSSYGESSVKAVDSNTFSKGMIVLRGCPPATFQPWVLSRLKNILKHSDSFLPPRIDALGDLNCMGTISSGRVACRSEGLRHAPVRSDALWQQNAPHREGYGIVGTLAQVRASLQPTGLSFWLLGREPPSCPPFRSCRAPPYTYPPYVPFFQSCPCCRD